MKKYTVREMDKILRRNDFNFIGYGGRGSSHRKYKRNGIMVVINKNLQEPVARRIIKENKLILDK